MNDDDTTSLATGVVLFLFGVFLIARTVTHDDHHHNLVDRILGLDTGTAASTTTTAVPGSATVDPPAARPQTDPSTLRVRHPSTTHLVHPVSRM